MNLMILTIFLVVLELNGLLMSKIFPYSTVFIAFSMMVACRHDIKQLMRDETDEYIEDEDYENMKIDLPLAYSSAANSSPVST
jgi:hypothetical protein